MSSVRRLIQINQTTGLLIDTTPHIHQGDVMSLDNITEDRKTSIQNRFQQYDVSKQDKNNLAQVLKPTDQSTGRQSFNRSLE